MNAQILELAEELDSHFEQHPDAEVVRSLPGLGTILSARVLGEFGDEPNRYANAKSRKNYAGTSPITRASGTKRVVLARFARNHPPGRRHLPMGVRLSQCITWSSGLLRLPQIGGRHPSRRTAPAGQPPRRHPPRLPDHHTNYDEGIAWGHRAGLELSGAA